MILIYIITHMLTKTNSGYNLISKSHMTDGCGSPQGSMTEKADRLGTQPGKSAFSYETGRRNDSHIFHRLDFLNLKMAE